MFDLLYFLLLLLVCVVNSLCLRLFADRPMQFLRNKLHVAVREGNVDDVKQLLPQMRSSDITAGPQMAPSSLRVLIRECKAEEKVKVEIARALIEAGVNYV